MPYGGHKIEQITHEHAGEAAIRPAAHLRPPWVLKALYRQLMGYPTLTHGFQTVCLGIFIRTACAR